MNTVLVILIAVLLVMNFILLFSYAGTKLNTYDDIPVQPYNLRIGPKVYVVSLVSMIEGHLTFVIPGQDSVKLVDDVKNSITNHILLDGTLYTVEGVASNMPHGKLKLVKVGMRNIDQSLKLDSTNMTVMILGYNL